MTYHDGRINTLAPRFLSIEMTTPTSTTAQSIMIRQIRMRMVKFWAIFALGLILLYILLRVPSMPSLVTDFLAVPFVWIAGRIRARPTYIPIFARTSSTIWKWPPLWVVISGAIIINVSASLSTPEQHRHVYYSYLLLFVFFS